MYWKTVNTTKGIDIMTIQGSLKVTVLTPAVPPVEPDKYPSLWKSGRTGSIFLLTAPGTGFVVYPGSPGSPPIGSESHGWSMASLEKFNGKVTLENDG